MAKLVDEIIIRIRPLRAKRITPWFVECNSCGPVRATRKKKWAIGAGVDHSNKKHKGTASFRLIGEHR